ncbi:MAG: YgcG family protein [Nitrosomonas sp.]|nr:MAG: YgcG family protein [Nitrosomonas sp.]
MNSFQRVRSTALTTFSILLLVIQCWFIALVSAEIAIPPLKSRVTDLTHTLSTQESSQLEQQLAQFEASNGSQIALLIVPSTQPETIEQYAIRVADAWKLGRKGIDDGVLLLVAKNDRAFRIEVGYGLEGILPDAVAKRIIEETIVPAFRQGQFFGGVQAGISQIIRVVQGESLPLPKPMTPGLNVILENSIPILVVFLVLGKVLQAMFGRMFGASVTGAIAGSIVWLIFSSLAAAALIAIIVFVISLFEDTGRGIYRGGRGGHWPGGGWGGGGFGGGGFSGGGGGFGGGGASGRW